MAFTNKNWLDRECEYPDRRLLNPTDGGAARSFTVERDEGLVYEEGDRFNAATMNNMELRIQTADKEQTAALNTHKQDTANPHKVTKAQAGLGNVDNIQQATKTEFTQHATSTANPHGVTKSQVGLASVDNVQQATKTEFTQHATSKSNPHEVTASQIGAIDEQGGHIRGNFSVGYNGVKFTTGANYMHAFMGDDSYGHAFFDFRCTGSGFLFRKQDGNDFMPLYASNVTSPSAARYKRDFTPFTRAGAEALLPLPVYRYRYQKNSGFDDGHVHTGLVAEDVAAVDESYIYRGQNGEVEGVNYPALVPVLLRLLQAQNEDLDGLRQQVEALSHTVAGLQKQLNTKRGGNAGGEHFG